MNRPRARSALVAIACLCATGALAAGEFPVASCQSWNGTVVERWGIDHRYKEPMCMASTVGKGSPNRSSTAISPICGSLGSFQWTNKHLPRAS